MRIARMIVWTKQGPSAWTSGPTKQSPSNVWRWASQLHLLVPRQQWAMLVLWSDQHSGPFIFLIQFLLSCLQLHLSLHIPASLLCLYFFAQFMFSDLQPCKPFQLLHRTRPLRWLLHARVSDTLSMYLCICICVSIFMYLYFCICIM